MTNLFYGRRRLLLIEDAIGSFPVQQWHLGGTLPALGHFDDGLDRE